MLRDITDRIHEERKQVASDANIKIFEADSIMDLIGLKDTLPLDKILASIILKGDYRFYPPHTLNIDGDGELFAETEFEPFTIVDEREKDFFFCTMSPTLALKDYYYVFPTYFKNENGTVIYKHRPRDGVYLTDLHFHISNLTLKYQYPLVYTGCHSIHLPFNDENYKFMPGLPPIRPH